MKGRASIAYSLFLLKWHIFYFSASIVVQKKGKYTVQQVFIGGDLLKLW
jgi:hypothetical protein